MNKNPTILYVEDEKGIRNELSRFLKHFSSELFVACDGMEGLDFFKKKSPDIVISDIKMPNMNGIEMVKKIKEIDPGQYIIFTTAHSESSYFMEAIEMRINGFVLKPIDLEILEEKLEYITNQINTKKTKEIYEGYILQQSRLAQMGEIVSMIAHQWRQPLSAISAISTNLQLSFEFEQFDLTEDNQREKQKNLFQEELAHLDKSLKYLSSVIDDFSSFYKPDQKAVPTKLEDIISRAFNIMPSLLDNEEIQVVLEYNSCKLVVVYINELSQVMVNLLKNAQESFICHNVVNPKIRITIDDNKIKIYNNGSHIEKDVLDKIFDPYFSTKNEKNGTGLGLYMSKIIIEKHHKGKLSVENTQDGVCFIIEFKSKED